MTGVPSSRRRRRSSFMAAVEREPSSNRFRKCLASLVVRGGGTHLVIDEIELNNAIAFNAHTPGGRERLRQVASSTNPVRRRQLGAPGRVKSLLTVVVRPEDLDTRGDQIREFG